MGTLGIIQFMERSAVGTGYPGNGVGRILYRIHSIKLQLFAILTAVDIDRKRSREQVSPGTYEPPVLPHLKLFPANMDHASAAAETDILFHTIPPCRQKTPPVHTDRGRKITRYHLWFAPLSRSGPQVVPTHDGAITGAPDTALLGPFRSGGCSRVYFPAYPLPLSPNRGFSGRDGRRYFSLSLQ